MTLYAIHDSNGVMCSDACKTKRAAWSQFLAVKPMSDEVIGWYERSGYTCNPVQVSRPDKSVVFNKADADNLKAMLDATPQVNANSSEQDFSAVLDFVIAVDQFLEAGKV